MPMHRFTTHARRNAVAYVALFFALSGTGAMAGKSLITGADIQDGTIAAADLAKDSVTSPKILDGSIVGPDLEADSVDSSKILDGSIVGPDLQANAVTSDKILDASIVGPDLQANSITSAKILNGTIVGPDLQANTLGGGEIDESSLGKVPTAASADTVGGFGAGLLVKGGGSIFSRVVSGFLGHQESSDALAGVASAPEGASIMFSCFVNAPHEPVLLLKIRGGAFLTSWGVRVGDQVIGPTVGGAGAEQTWQVTQSDQAVGSNAFLMQASDENGSGFVVDGSTRNADGHCSYQAQVTVTGQ